MVFFNKVDRHITAEELLHGDEYTTYYMNNVSFDCTGNFVCGNACYEEATYNLAEIANIDCNGDVGRVINALKDVFSSNSDACSIFIEHVSELLRNCNMGSQYCPLNMEILSYIDSKKSFEVNHLTFSDSYKYRVRKSKMVKNSSSVSNYVDFLNPSSESEEIYVDCVSCEHANSIKSSFERDNYNNEKFMKFSRVRADVILDYMSCTGGIVYSMFKNYMTQVSYALQSRVLKQSDFFDNPFSPMMDSCYNPNVIDERVGTRLVNAINEFGFDLMSDRIISAHSKLSEIHELSSEVNKIPSREIRDIMTLALMRIEQDKSSLIVLSKYFEKKILQLLCDENKDWIQFIQ